jgi:di/tricarboxylate transporter
MVLSAMQSQLLLIIVGMLILITATNIKTEIIALIVLITLALTGFVDPRDAISGFGSSVVITLMGLFIIVSALEKAGVVNWIARRLNTLGKGSEGSLIIVFMTAASLLSLIMNNVAAGAVLLPAAVRVARESGVAAGKLLIPMSFGTLVGGMATYFTTANILMSELLESRGFRGLNMGDFLPVGGLIVVGGILYMLLIGRRLLPGGNDEEQNGPARPHDLSRTYNLSQHQWLLEVLEDSPLAGKTIAESKLHSELGLTVTAIQRRRRVLSIPGPEARIRKNDRLLVVGTESSISSLSQWGTRVLDRQSMRPRRKALLVEPIEISIAPRSGAIGKTLKQIRLNRDYGILAIGLWRDGVSYTDSVRDIPLEIGDAILVVANSDSLEKIAGNPDFILPAGRYSDRPVDRRRAPQTLIISAAALMLGIFEITPLPIAMLIGSVALVLSNCISVREMYEAVSWKVIFLVSGMLPLSYAISDSGLAEQVGASIVRGMSGYDPILLVAAMVGFTMLVAQIIGGQVSALLVGPVAITAAIQSGIDPRAISVAVAMSCSMAFLTPIAHPVNVLVLGPGNYHFMDFPKVGIGITITSTLILLVGLKFFWGV